MHIVLITGPKQSGKSTLRMQLVKILGDQIGADAVSAQELKAPLIIMLNAIVDGYYPEFKGLDYEQLKKTQLGGMTGRDMMIALGNALRERDPSNLPRMLLKRVSELPKQPRIVIIDDLGFEPEYQAFLHTPGTNQPTVVYMEKRGDRLYGHGQQFDGDSRVCLRGHAGWIDPDPEELARAILDDLGA